MNAFSHDVKIIGSSLHWYAFLSIVLLCLCSIILRSFSKNDEAVSRHSAIASFTINFQSDVFTPNCQLAAFSPLQIDIGPTSKSGMGTSSKVQSQRDPLQEELSKAALVVRGRVKSNDLPDSNMPTRISEHDPLLRGAVIEIRQVLKGKITTKDIMVYYASSDDVKWYRSPKPPKGLGAVFLLRADSSSPKSNAKRYILLNYFDVKKTDTIRIIQRLLHAPH